MIILMPEKTFKKKIEKYVKHKEFIIADALARHNGGMREYGNRIDAEAIHPTPTLIKIATDPDSEEAKIKKRSLGKYVNMWLNDEALNISIFHLVLCILKSYDRYQEDCNVFVVLRNPIFYAYHKYLVEKINDDYGTEVATILTHKMEKDDVREILKRKFDREHFKTLRKSAKRIKKSLDIKDDIELCGMDE